MAKTKSVGFNIGEVVMEMLEEYADEVKKEVIETTTQFAPKATLKLANASPKETGEYARGWTYKSQTDHFGTVSVTVYNSAKPSLTHILENGYTARNGRRIKGQKHIQPVEKWIEKELPEELERAINDIQ